MCKSTSVKDAFRSLKVARKKLFHHVFANSFYPLPHVRDVIYDRQQKSVNFPEELRYITFFLDNIALSIVGKNAKYCQDTLMNRPQVSEINGNTITLSGHSKVENHCYKASENTTVNKT